MRKGNPDYILLIDDIEIKFKNIQSIVEYLNKKVNMKLFTRQIISNLLNEGRSANHRKYSFFSVKRC